MNGHQIHIFATKADLEALLRVIESKRELQFVKTGFFDIPVVHRVTTLLDDACFGIAMKGDNNHETRFLVADRAESINIEVVPQHSGSTKYAIGSQKINPKTIIFWPARCLKWNVTRES